jgi:EAL domain-containing protein (putative c-di-GMP-specific phosphodiesterase class I)
VTFLLLAIGLSGVLCSITLIALIRRSLLRWVGGISEWAWACGFLILGSILFGEGETRSVGLVRLAANISMFAALFLMYASLCKFAGLAVGYRWLATLIGAATLCLAWLIATDASYPSRAFCVMLTQSILFGASAKVLFQIRDGAIAGYAMRILFCALAAISIARLFAIGFGYEQSDIMQASSVYQRAYLFASASCLVGLVLSYMLFVAARLRQMIQRVAAVGIFDRVGDAEKSQIERDLQNAVAKSELMLHFQPRICLRTHRIAGVEALLRWNHPSRGTLLPSQFVHIGEETPAIVAIGEWVVNEAANALQRLQAGGHAGLIMSINVSAKQLGGVSLPTQIARLLKRAGYGANQIELELTESSFVHNRDDALRVLSELKGMGVRLAVDDFGTGYSSLAYIKHWPIDCVKIDRSFVSDLPHDPGDVAITRAITAMGHALGLHVVAEGVEKPEQLEFLREIGCDEYQGYLVSKPLPEAELVEFLDAWPSRESESSPMMRQHTLASA